MTVTAVVQFAGENTFEVFGVEGARTDSVANLEAAFRQERASYSFNGDKVSFVVPMRLIEGVVFSEQDGEGED